MRGFRVRRALLVGVVGGALVALSPTPSQASVARTPAPAWQTNGTVHAVLYANGRVYLGGDFTQLRSTDGSQVVTRNHIAAIIVSTGSVDTGFNPNADGRVSALATDGTSIFAGGGFGKIGGMGGRHRVAELNPTNGRARDAWNTNGRVEALAAGGGRLYVGGTFTSFEGVARSYLAAVNLSDSSVISTWRPAADARVRALEFNGSAVYAGGDFLRIDGVSHRQIARLNATTGSAAGFNGSAGGEVWGLTSDATTVYAAVGGGGGDCLALNGTTGARRWVVGANGNMHGVALLGGLLYCGGHFGGVGSFGGQTRYKLAAVDAATGAVDPFAPRVNSATGVLALDTDGTSLFAGGGFTRITGAYQQGFAKFG